MATPINIPTLEISSHLTDFGKSLIPSIIKIKCNAVTFQMQPLEPGSLTGKAKVILQRVEGDTIHDLWVQEFDGVSQRLGDTLTLRLPEIELPLNLQSGTGDPLIVEMP